MPLAQLFFWKLEHLDPYPYTFQPINGLLEADFGLQQTLFTPSQPLNQVR